MTKWRGDGVMGSGILVCVEGPGGPLMDLCSEIAGIQAFAITGGEWRKHFEGHQPVPINRQ